MMANDRMMLVCSACERETEFPVEDRNFTHFVCLSKRFAEWGHTGNSLEKIQEWLKDHTFCGEIGQNTIKIVCESEYQPWASGPPKESNGEAHIDLTLDNRANL